MVPMGKILNNLKLSYTTVVHNGIMTHRKQQKIKNGDKTFAAVDI